ncbi:MAG: TlpA disulfide reductase family protein [Polyangia bacterium]
MDLESEKRASGRMRRLLPPAVGVAVGALLLWTYAEAVAEGMTVYRRARSQLVAPDFVASDPAEARKVPDFTLKDRYGNQVSLSHFSSVDLLLVNIWASSCRVCLEETPALAELDRRIGELGSAALITIAVEEKWADVAHYFPRGTDLRVLFDPENEVGLGVFGTEAYPETFVLDARRRMRARFDGARPWHSDAMLDYLGRFL